MRQVSWSNKHRSWDLIVFRAVYGRDDVPVDVSWIGDSGALKSPPNTRVPSWKFVKRSVMVRKNGT